MLTIAEPCITMEMAGINVPTLKLEESEPLPADFFDHEPSKSEKLEMRKASKPPSEWLKLLCHEWTYENIDLLNEVDAKFLAYKSYLKGQLSSQLLCRLSIQEPIPKDVDPATVNVVDFWKILGINDEFDKSYIVAQVERFCLLYNIRGTVNDGDTALIDHGSSDKSVDAATAIAAGITMSPAEGIMSFPAYLTSGLDPGAAAAAAAAAADVAEGKFNKRDLIGVHKNYKLTTESEKTVDVGENSVKHDQRKATQEKRDARAKEREAQTVRKAADKAARDATREERRHKKLMLRQQREKFAQEQKDAALKRAAELVRSNRVPIEITRGAAAAQAAANAAMAFVAPPSPETVSNKKPRSAIVVSTAADLNQIVTHSKNLWAKYNAIAKEHNQKVNWITVAKELGIHVKVREKYARMHARAEQRGFDFVECGHYKLKDYTHIFMEPTQSEQKLRMPLPLSDPATTVLIYDGEKDAANQAAMSAAAAVAAASVDPTEVEAAAAAATMAVDASIKTEELAIKAEEVSAFSPTANGDDVQLVSSMVSPDNAAHLTNVGGMQAALAQI